MSMSRNLTTGNKSSRALGSARVAGVPYKQGDSIGRFGVRGVLGSGGFGIVYLVYSADLLAAYALKTLHDVHWTDEGTKERFRNEARIWVDLEHHPFIVRAHFV